MLPSLNHRLHTGFANSANLLPFKKNYFFFHWKLLQRILYLTVVEAIVCLNNRKCNTNKLLTLTLLSANYADYFNSIMMMVEYASFFPFLCIGICFDRDFNLVFLIIISVLWFLQLPNIYDQSRFNFKRKDHAYIIYFY